MVTKQKTAHFCCELYSLLEFKSNSKLESGQQQVQSKWGLVLLKGHCHEVFDLWFFFTNQPHLGP
jgi:hypothetical protein